MAAAARIGMRLGLEIFDACRQVFPAERPSACGFPPPTGSKAAGTSRIPSPSARELKPRGCDYLCTSSGGVSLKQEINARPGYQVPLAQAVRQGAGITTVAVGQITEPRQAEVYPRRQKADMIAIARRLMFNPHWAWSAAAELGVFLKYPARYRNANPRIGQAMDFRNRRRNGADSSRSCARRSESPQARGW